MMNPDQDLRDRFAHQRRADHAAAPAWNPDLLHTAASVRRPSRLAWRLLPAAACLLALGVFWPGWQAGQPSPDLASALPPFFTPQGDPLFAGLSSSPDTPSDILLPLHLTIQLP